jgi:CBS domain containing-hemolysin-like protein
MELGLLLLFFMLAGYFGAVRSVLLELSIERHSNKPEYDKLFAEALYWRRILRMIRLAVIGIGCFYGTTFLFPFFEQTLNQSPLINYGIILVGLGVLWLMCYLCWLKLGYHFPTLLSLNAFPVKLGEWIITPLYWLVEPFVKESILTATNRGELLLVDDSDLQYPSEEQQMFINALDFKDLRIRDCMIPRTEISSVNVDDSINDLKQTFLSSGHSKIIVQRDSSDEILGYCHALSLFKKPKDIASIVTPILIVPEAMPVSDLMLRFLEERRSLALVVDEFGGTAGLVSVEDVVEQIFGEIQDEYDSTEDWIERIIDPYTYILSARHEVDYLNEKYDWRLPEGDYDTLAGLLIHIHGDLPDVNDIIEIPPYTFQIISMHDTRIEQVKMTIEEVK